MQIHIFARLRKKLKKKFRIFLHDFYTKDPKYFHVDSKNYFDTHIFYLSRKITSVDDEINIALVKGRNVPRLQTKWLKDATALMKAALSKEKHKESESEELKNLSDQIFNSLKDCPVEDEYDEPITFVAGLHNVEDNKMSKEDVLEQQPSLPKDHEDVQEIYTADIESMSSDQLYQIISEVLLNEGTSSQVNDDHEMKSENSSLIEFSSPSYVISERFESVDDSGLDRRREKMPLTEIESISDSQFDPDEIGGLTSENSDQLHEMSHLINGDELVPRPTQPDEIKSMDSGRVIPSLLIRFEMLSSSTSEETDISTMNKLFGLDFKRDYYYLFFSAMENDVLQELDDQIILIGGEEKGGPTLSTSLPEYLVVNRSGRSSDKMPTDDEWWQAGVVNLSGKNFLWLNEEQDCPNLVLLFLQRNSWLTHIPPLFFDRMPSLRFLDLSYTRVRTLPDSLFKLTDLQVLLLRGCISLERIPAAIEKLENLQVLDLLCCDLYNIPEEIGQLTQLKHLQLSFYGPDFGSGYARLPEKLFSPSIFSKMKNLEGLTIVVHPEDERWISIAADVIHYIRLLEKLSHLDFYFPTIDALSSFVKDSPSWNKQRVKRFNFIVGHNIKRIISRVHDDVDSKYEQLDQCLKFINGNEVPQLIKGVLKSVQAFYLDRHLEIKNLSEFGISNFKALQFCIVRECPNINVVVVESKSSTEKAFPNLEHLGLHYLWNLEQIYEGPLPPGSFKALKHLTVETCLKLTYIASRSMLECLANLESFIIEDCESLKSIVKPNKIMTSSDAPPLLPQIKELVIRHLPKFTNLGSGLRIPEEKIFDHCCPKFILPQRTKRRKLLSSPCRICIN